MISERPSDGELEEFRGRVRRFIADQSPPIEAREGHRAPTSPQEEAHLREWFGRLFDEGLIGASWPREFGGRLDYHPLQDRIVSEELLLARAPRPVEQVSLAANILLRFGTEDQKLRFLPRIRSGEDIWCQLLSEPNAGSDIAGVRIKAQRQPDNSYVVTGQKTWITDGHWADMGIALVRSDPSSDRHRGLSILLVPMRSPGIEVRPLVTMGGVTEVNEVFFDDVHIAAENLVGNEGEGWRVIMEGLDIERLGMASNAVLLELLLADLIVVARVLRIDGSRAVDLDDVRQLIAELTIEAAVTRAVVDDHVERVLDGREGEGDAAVAKISFAECYHRIAATAVALAESGVLVEDSEAAAALGRLQDSWLWSRAYTVSAGSSEIMRNILAKRRLQLPGSR